MNLRALCACVLAAGALFSVPRAAQAQDEHPRYHLYAAADFGHDPAEVTFNRDIAPILARSCVGCHRVGGAAPMAFASYRDVRRYARLIKE
jgi:hypothetical protein